MIGDTQTAALIGDDGSVDWMCAPRFDSGACFAALLGDENHGRWLIAPAAGGRATRRRYRDHTLVLETEFETPEGAVRIIDFMPIRDKTVDMVRIVEGVHGHVPMQMHLTIRFDYGQTIPWVRNIGRRARGRGGAGRPRAARRRSRRGRRALDGRRVHRPRGQRVPFSLAWFPSHEDVPRPSTHGLGFEPDRIVVARTGRRSGPTTATGPKRCSGRSSRSRRSRTRRRAGSSPRPPPRCRSGSAASATGTTGSAGFATRRSRSARLIDAGYQEEARAWREWLLRAIAGEPDDLQIMYGPAGERRLTEWEVPWLPGYEGSKPVRVGNAASEQFQLDVYGEVIDALYQSRRRRDRRPRPPRLDLILALLDFLEDAWKRARRGDLGGARPATALHPLEGHGVGRVRPRRARVARVRYPGRHRRCRLALRQSATRSTPRCAPRRTTPTATRSSSPTARPTSTPPC